ncbi:MAG: class I SAM-dependent methyltransferase family protein [Thermoplasmata archaeon]|nr:class I SAM-dependent methyltransferase family protein [Thermoplasmata archaeon]
MTRLGLRVAEGDAESARRELRARGLLELGVPWIREPGFVVIPLTTAPTPAPGVGKLVEREFAPAEKAAAHSYRELLELSPELAEKLPRSFDVVGDVVLVRLPPELAEHASAVGRALLAFVPGARVVAADHGVHGVERRRMLEPLAGEGGFRTLHRENGLEFEVDVEAAYFSPRLGREHARVSEQVRPGERVLDLCCGIGPFALTIACRGRAASVAAVDVNPAAIELLRANAARLRPTVPVESVVGDAEQFLRQAGTYDRAILNLPHDGLRFLPSLGPHLSPRGRLHLYAISERSDPEGPGAPLVAALGPGWSVEESHVVHPYSPGADVVGLTICQGGE